MFRRVLIACAVVTATGLSACVSTAPSYKPSAPGAVVGPITTAPSDPCAEDFRQMLDSIIEGRLATRTADTGTATMEADNMIANFKRRHHCAP